MIKNVIILLALLITSSLLAQDVDIKDTRKLYLQDSDSIIGSYSINSSNAIEKLLNYKFKYPNSNAEIITMGVIRLKIDNDIEKPQELKAFPSAYGAGAYTTGGRGGIVVHVTNLKDSGTGSFREALTMTEPRNIVFDVSGVIKLLSLLYLDNTNGNVTISGQTSPKGGITIDGNLIYWENPSNVIFRHIRFRGGMEGTLSSQNDSFTMVKNIKDIIIDHCSFSFADDENASWFSNDVGNDIRNITIQSCLFGEGSKGSIVGGNGNTKVGEITVYRNLYYNQTHRYPNVMSYNIGQVEIINNVAWTVVNRLIQYNGDGNLNHQGNYYDYGNQKYSVVRMHQVGDSENKGTIYTEGNKIVASNGSVEWNGLNPKSLDKINRDNKYSFQWFVTSETRGEQVPNSWFTNTPFKLNGDNAFVTILSADNAFKTVKSDVGCNARLNGNGSVGDNKDILDTEWLNNVNNGLYVARSSTYTWNVPNIDSVTRPSNYDTDKDGMPDIWELDKFNTLDRDGKGDLDGDGYTDLEEFLNLVDNK